jgi:hypothetical protein
MELSNDYSVVVDPESGRKIIVHNENWQISDKSLETYFSNFVAGGINGLNSIRVRASVEEVIEFANDVRSAGGGNLIDGLMPSVPEEPNSCLIANALNFDCEVNSHAGDWYMEVDDGEIGMKIADTLALSYYGGEQDDDGFYWEPFVITLPYGIGCVAEAFDTYCDYELEQYNKNNQN